MKKLLFLLAIIATVNNTFSVGSQQNQPDPFAERMALKQTADQLFEVAQNCDNPEIVQKVLENINLDDKLIALKAFHTKNNKKLRPEDIILERARETQSTDCAFLYLFLRKTKADFEAEYHILNTERETIENLEKAGFSLTQPSNEKDQGKKTASATKDNN